MDSPIDIASIYDKPINFLIGSGASHGLFPTLALGIKDDFEQSHTIETLASALKGRELDALFAHYYMTCIRPAQVFNVETISKDDAAQIDVHNNYKLFLRTVLYILSRRTPKDPRCNIFTTNYDGCFQYAAEALVREGQLDFILNDGTAGFKRKLFQPRTFNSYFSRTGIFERSASTVPQINLIHVHGSVYWRKEKDEVVVDYVTEPPNLVDPELRERLAQFSADLLNSEKSADQLEVEEALTDPLKSFFSAYEKLPIVNPRKWKFHETVFEEHYYHMLRMLSYELEKPNAVLIVFGFSFADEHILSLVKRSLANSSLQIFICCFDANAANTMRNRFSGFSNVAVIHGSEQLTFTRFNSDVFQLPNLQDLSFNEPEAIQ